MTQAGRSDPSSSTRIPNAHSRPAGFCWAETSLTCPRILLPTGTGAGKPDPVDAVVHGGRHRVDLENVVEEHRTERQRQVTVRDRAPVGALRGAPGLHVD